MDDVVIKAIAFDKDGVLVDFDRTWVNMLVDMARLWAGGDDKKNARLLETAGYDAASNSFFSGSVWAAGNTADLVAVWDETGNQAEQEKLTQFINRQCLDCEIIPLFPVEELQGLFDGLSKAGLQLGITTNDVEASALKTMDAFGLSQVLSLIVGYDSVTNPKPAADPMLAFCDHCGLAPAQIAVVGDNVHDMEMAQAGGAGLRIGVLSGNSTAAELRPHADFLLDSVMDLPHLLQDKI